MRQWLHVEGGPRRLRRLARHYWPALLLAALATGAAAIGWGNIFRAGAGGIHAAVGVGWPLLRLPGLFILATTWLLVRAQSRWRHGVPVRGSWLVAGFAALVVGLVLGSILLFPVLLVDRSQRRLPPGQPGLTAEQRVTAENAARTTLLQAVAGLVLVVGAGATWRQLHINREGQITERFNKAIDHLGQPGADKLDVRLGGIYALERIAINSRADRATIAEILTAYVRGHAPWPPTRPGQYEASAPIRDVPKLQARTADIQSVMTVLGRSKHPPTGPVVLDLEATDLRKADLEGADLQGASLRGTHLEGAILMEANLQGADLTDANLQGANLWHANLEGANLWHANLEGAFLGEANLQDADLRMASLFDARLEDANLEGANLVQANLQRADLSGVNLWGAHLPVLMSGARATAQTTWPAGFNRQSPEAIGVRFEGEEAGTPEL
jgi:Pentapeptide repeats (8 copies)